MKRILPLFFLAPSLCFAGSSFERKIEEIQVVDEVVRLKIGVTYGACGAIDSWWGWSINDPSHSAWYAMALSAQARDRPVTVYDKQSACGGLPTAIELEGLYLK
ncbi:MULTISPECIES: hypothetical protein [Pseudoalteromonas]|uniref:Uncharacterized protein n=1 Tax=Pseudoalteromonas rubra TaxID=43658 RepID=A0A5S3V075_9GAMM|nr:MULTISPECIES: hypothetical protein [Pseudoalteromonas]MCG7562392.1 hypothetical protein [Pseudoalteromonas sp. McH1-42]MEC4087243.1 hypothetical protein [Pseudoalteromonas rubra]QPB83741.1 hypothetical protein CWC22_012355 [Pseudoalteromonas rubra]